MIRNIPKERFDIYSFSKSPHTHLFSLEKEWSADEYENVLGAVVLDKYDQDWGYVVLGRDEDGVFKCIDVDVSFRTIGKARNELFHSMDKYSSSGDQTFPQRGWDGKKNEIFRQIVSDEILHPIFKELVFSEQYSPAKEVIRELAYSFEDPDGNYIQQFQSSGFNSRLWELYLYAFLHEQRFEISRDLKAPDYLANKFGFHICIEATTVNPSEGVALAESWPTGQEIAEKLKDFIPIKFGSALYSKLSKKYWELPHVSGQPLLIAIHDFHDRGSMMWSQSGLITYLYGYRYQQERNAEGQLTLIPQKVEVHHYGDKEIPSGFFFLPEADNISGVLFSNSATLSKFNRIGKLAGFGSPRVQMIRQGLKYDFNPNSANPKPFVANVQQGEYSETWSEGVSIFHNPRAKNPLPAVLFNGVGHHHLLENKQVESHMPDFFPVSSTTHIITTFDK